MQPTWLVALSWSALAVGLASSALIVADTYIRGYRQPVKIMEIVWPVTALYLGPAAATAYQLWAKPEAPQWRHRFATPPRRPRPPKPLIELCHCGAHCTLGSIIAEVAIFAFGFSLRGEMLWADYIGDYLLAVTLGVVFRYSASTRRDTRRIWVALLTVAKDDLLSVSAFELALFVWLALTDRVIFAGSPLRPDSAVFWFFLQIGLITGFLAAWPVTLWLIRRGVKAESPTTPQ